MAQKKIKAMVNQSFRIKGGEAKVGDVVELDRNDFLYLKYLKIVSDVQEEKVEDKKESKKNKKNEKVDFE